MFHLCWSSNCWLYFYLISFQSDHSIVSYKVWIKGSLNMILDLHSISWLQFTRYWLFLRVPSLSCQFEVSGCDLKHIFHCIQGKDVKVINQISYLGSNKVLRGKTGSLPNMRKKGDSFECSFGMKL